MSSVVVSKSLKSHRFGNPSPATGLAGICALLLIIMLFSSATRLVKATEWSAFGTDIPQISSPSAALIDGEGNVLYALNADERMPMASITKVMTAVVALESGVPLTTLYTISDSILDLDPVSSVIGYTPGETVTLDELIRGLLVHSGNDAALCIAECVAGSESAFVDRMNAKAVELGLYSTHFANPHGLDQEGHYSTPSDLVSLARYAMGIPYFANVVGSPQTEVAVGGVPTSFTSTNVLLNSYPGMRGIKTGYTGGAGLAFLGTATRGGQALYAVVLGAESSDQRWEDISTLLDWGFAHCTQQTLVASQGVITGYIPFVDRYGWSVGTHFSSVASLLVSPIVLAKDITVVYEAGGSAILPGTQVGQLTWRGSGGGVVASDMVVASTYIVPTQTFGPVVSNSFYGLDRF